MVLAMALLSVTDLSIKQAAKLLPIGQVQLGLALGGTLLVSLYVRATGARLMDRRALHPMVIWRNILELLASIGLVVGTALVPLSVFAAIMQTAPLVVTVGAAFLLKEQVGLRRWMAVAAGIVGMLLVIRPGTSDITWAALIAVFGVVMLALRDLVTRLSPADIPATALSAWGFAATIPGGLVMLAITGDRPVFDAAGFAWLGVMIVVTSVGYVAITTAMRVAPAAIVSPFRYARLVFTMGLGILVLGERPDPLTLLGAAIICAAGLYTFFRERQLARANAFHPAPARVNPSPTEQGDAP
ncbi:EamA family transporter [Rhodobacterales bacterium HKCCE3408]|nr:EamA family transporter [Rhodobacterales bacterium HKCCE3408]